jgi:uncharacterized membrane protein YbhN (UPF0104 family)
MKRGWWRALVPFGLIAIAVALIWWRGPDWHLVRHTFTTVVWPWIAVAVALNLLSVLARSIAWNIVIHEAVEAPRPRFRSVFSAFCVGLFANAVLPGRVGEVARVAVLARRMPGRKGIWATLLGTVFAHRMFDLIPATLLVVWVLSFADLPHWAVMTIVVVLGVGGALFVAAIFGARVRSGALDDGIGRVHLLLARGRTGLAVMRRPLAAAGAAFFQLLGWVCQLFAVYTAMRGFRIYEPLVAAGLVLLIMNVVTIIPFWPGNIGLVQAAIAVSLAQYGVRYAKGFAFGIGLQLIEASVGIGIGTVFLAREGISFATLRDIESEEERHESPEPEVGPPERAAALRDSG